ncbi:MAG TPA: hypothetical protein VLH39_01530, partial [Magnetospirillaceae bacterium]|nr:hypothetical protein [Magnetospirillaceae bacterium]
REAERRTAEGAVYDRLGRVREAALAPRQADAASGGIPAPAPATTADRPPDSGPAVSSVVPAVPFVTFSSAPVRTRQPLREEVLSLNSRGFSAELIAAKLGVTVAEVDLIVSLEEQKGLAARGEQGG